MCETQRKKTIKGVKIHIFLVCAWKSQDFAQSQKNFVQSHDRETMTFRNSSPSTLHRLVSPLCKKKTLGTRHLTPDMWHVTCDIWHTVGGGGWTFSQNCSSLDLTIWDIQCLEDSKLEDDLLDQLMNHQGVRRTALATPDLLNRVGMYGSEYSKSRRKWNCRFGLKVKMILTMIVIHDWLGCFDLE